MFRLTFLAIGFTLVASSIFANPNYYFNIGLSKPFAPEEFQQDWRSGFNVGVGVGYNLSPKFEIQGEFLYDNFQLDDNSYLSGVTESNDLYASVSGGSISLYGLYANFKYLSLSQKKTTLTPYLIGCLGFAFKSIAEMEVTTAGEMYTVPQESLSAFCAGLGLGVEIFMGNRTSFLVEGRFNLLFTDETTVYFPLKLGIVIR